jgi:hypothetical protein
MRVSFGTYFDFDIYVTPMVMRVIYLVGAIVITFFSLILIFFQGPLLSLSDNSLLQAAKGLMLAIGVAILIFGNIFWRIFCELLVVLFKIQTTLNSIDRTLVDASLKR